MASFCRGCRQPLSRPVPARLSRGGVSLFSVPGKFRQPPAYAHGFVYAQSLDGGVLEISARPGAEPRETGRMGLAATGFNRGAMVNVQPGERRDVRGWTYLGISPEGVEALMPATRRNVILYRVQSGRTVFANGGEDEVLNMRGFSADGQYAVFVVRNGPETCTLTRVHLSADRPAETLFSLHGTDVAGPVIQGEFTAFITSGQAGLWGPRCGARSADFPDYFRPYLAFSDTDLNLPPGGLPLVIASTEGQVPALIVAGESHGQSGLLEMRMEGEPAPRFRALPRGSALNAGWNGTACLSSKGSIEVWSSGKSTRMDASSAQFMPATFTGPWVIWFGDDSYGGMHRLEARGPESFSLSFESEAFGSSTCFGAIVTGGDLLVGMLNSGAPRGKAELEFARWGLET